MLPTLSPSYQDPHSYPHGVAYQDGQYLLMKDAKISVLDYGFLHSDATYDTVHVWNGAFFRLDLHLDRFFAGLHKLRMTIPHTRAEVTEILSNCVALAGHRAAYVEMICTRGGSPTFSRDPRDAVNRFMAFAVPFGSVASPDQLARGLHLAISDVVRIPPKSVDPSIKNYHWLDLVQGLYDAYAQDAEPPCCWIPMATSPKGRVSTSSPSKTAGFPPPPTASFPVSPAKPCSTSAPCLVSASR